ncbi:PTS transporter subunit EIIC, partial [Clostridium perfringens]
QARACMEALVTYLTFNYFVNSMLTQWGSFFGVDFAQEVGGVSGLTTIAGIKTFDTGMIGAILIAGIAVWIHNRFFDTELPEYLGIFRGSS